MTDAITTDDILDSRDIEARIEDLQERNEVAEDGSVSTDPLDDDEKAELTALQAFRDEAEGYCSDWKHGETLIKDSYFKEYAQELADDIGAISKGASWPNNCIDWDEAARQLQEDYTSAELMGETYWFR